MSTFHQDTPQFGSNKPGGPGSSNNPTQCAECEAMLADVLDGTLSPVDQDRFDSHMASCTACSEMLADAQRGAAWLELLRDPRPEPPALLVERILQRTAEAAQPISLVQAMLAAGLPYAPAPIATRSNLYAFPNRGKFTLRALQNTLLQPRLAMTAAMAFFSIGLTLNLTGVQLNQIRASELKPSSLRRSFYQANASVIRYYDNLRVVYELESRVRELQRTSDAEPVKQPDAEQQEKRPAPKSGAGSSRQQAHPLRVSPQSLAVLNDRITSTKKGELA